MNWSIAKSLVRQNLEAAVSTILNVANRPPYEAAVYPPRPEKKIGSLHKLELPALAAFRAVSLTDKHCQLRAPTADSVIKAYLVGP